MTDRVDRAKAIIDRLLGEEESYHGDWKVDCRRLWSTYLHPHRWRFVVAAVITVIWSAMPFGFAMTWRFLIDHVLLPAQALADTQRVRGVLTFFFFNTGIWSLHLIFHWSRGWIVHSTSRKLIFALRRDLHHKLAELHIGFFDRTPVGRIMSRVMDDVNVIQQSATNMLVSLIGSLVKILYGPALLFYLNWRLAIFVAGVLPLYALVFLRLRPRIRRSNIAMRRLNSRMYGLTAERVAGVRVLQVCNREGRETISLARYMSELVRVSMRLVDYQQGLVLLTQVITAVTTGLVILLAAMGVRDGDMSLGDMVAFISAMAATFAPVAELSNFLVQAQATLTVIRRVFHLLDEPIEVQTGRISLNGMAGRIHFDDVTFRYPGQQRAALRNMEFRVAPGESVALMGPSGSGKTTVFQLLLRFYDPEEGAIRVGGVNLTDADLESLRHHVCMVQQEAVVFSGTLAQNIGYGHEEATMDEIVQAARASELHGFVDSLPLKYETVVGESGMTLSGGQRQRLALATALLTRPEILLLDDTTSALDAATEARIRATLKEVLRARTSLIITQRMMTARDCDRIIVLNRGCIVQAGTHDQLIAQEGFYRTICEQQEHSSSE